MQVAKTPFVTNAPLTPARPVAPVSAAAAAPSASAEKRLRILVTDDDPIQRAFATAYLEKTAGDVQTCENGQEAVRRLSAEAFDCALLDIDMPHMNGFETLEALRSNPVLKRLPIIMVTSREDVASIDRAYRLGASSFTTKPVNWTLLSYQIRYVVREAAGR